MGSSDPVSAAGSVRKHRTQVSVSRNLDWTTPGENLKLRAVSKNPSYLISCSVHRVPEFPILLTLWRGGLCRIWQGYKAALHTGLVEFRIQSDLISWITGLHLPNAPYCDHNGLIVGIVKGIECVDVRNLLEQFGFRVRAQIPQPCCRDLQMEMPRRAIGKVMPALHK